MSTRKERDEYRAALLRGILTGETTGAFTYSKIAYLMGDAGWAALMSSISRSSSKSMSNAERYCLLLEELNKLYPEG
jgi:hypothetical protein